MEVEKAIVVRIKNIMSRIWFWAITLFHMESHIFETVLVTKLKLGRDIDWGIWVTKEIFGSLYF